MPQLKDDNLPQIAFQASEIQAVFPNGNQVEFKTDDIKAIKSPAGDDVIVLQQDNNLVRLYLTFPEHDWRANVTYSWQLSMAWMAADSSSENDQTEWLHWNRENNINSQIMGFSSVPLFSTESITLHFYAFDRMPWSHKTKESFPSTRIIMKNVLLGTQLQDDMALNERHRPCQSAVCEIIDGVVTSEGNTLAGLPVDTGNTGTTASQMLEGFPIYTVVLVALISSLFILADVFRRIKTKHYAPIESDGDESETEMSEVVQDGAVVKEEYEE